MKKIVIIDDHPDLLELLAYNLTLTGYEVQTFEHPNEALSFIESHPFATDVVVTDWMMPELNGIEVCKTLRKNPETQHLPIIMLTCKNTQTDKSEAYNNGVNLFLSKPFRVMELVVRINSLVKHSA